jgi:hypothetical protein
LTSDSVVQKQTNQVSVATPTNTLIASQAEAALKNALNEAENVILTDLKNQIASAKFASLKLKNFLTKKIIKMPLQIKLQVMKTLKQLLKKKAFTLNQNSKKTLTPMLKSQNIRREVVASTQSLNEAPPLKEQVYYCSVKDFKEQLIDSIEKALAYIYTPNITITEVEIKVFACQEIILDDKDMMFTFPSEELIQSKKIRLSYKGFQKGSPTTPVEDYLKNGVLVIKLETETNSGTPKTYFLPLPPVEKQTAAAKPSSLANDEKFYFQVEFLKPENFLFLHQAKVVSFPLNKQDSNNIKVELIPIFAVNNKYTGARAAYPGEYLAKAPKNQKALVRSVNFIDELIKKQPNSSLVAGSSDVEI